MASTPTAVFDVINDRIVRMLDEGIVPWRKPWRAGTGEGSRPRNVDGRPYSGINAFHLSLLGYSDPRWLTYKKATELGGSVRKGEKGAPVVFWKQLVIETENDNGETVKKRVPMLRYFTVFNVEQCDGLTVKPLPAAPVAEPVEGADTILALLDTLQDTMPNHPTIKHDGGDRAYYTPATDTIHLPKVESFHTPQGFAETATHELTHSTGHPSRLNREGVAGFDHFGSDQYAREELVAEFGAAFVMAELGIETPESTENLAAYIAGWKSRIAEDPKVLVVAAGRGEKAADYILGKSQPAEVEQDKAA